MDQEGGNIIERNKFSDGIFYESNFLDSEREIFSNAAKEKIRFFQRLVTDKTRLMAKIEGIFYSNKLSKLHHSVRPLKFNTRSQKLVTKQASLQQIFRKCITSYISISLCYFLSLNGSNCSDLKTYFIKYVKYPLTAIKINGFFHPAFKRVLLDP